MKKVLIALALVVVLMVGTVPAFAANEVATPAPWDCCTVPSWTHPLVAQWLECATTCYPIWVATYSDFCGPASANVVKDYKLWNGGLPVGFIEVNPSVVSPLQLAHIFMQEQGLTDKWKIRDLEINNVFKIESSVTVPKAVADACAAGKYKPGMVVPASPVPEMVNVPFNGYLLVVEPLYQEVTIKHHILREGQPEIVEETVALYPTNDKLDAARVPAEWAITKYVDVKYDAALTVVGELRPFDKALGQNVFRGYVVDMFYTAGKSADGAKVDAANAANAAKQLPATGAANYGFAMLSSIAALVLGFFFIKK